MAAMPTDDPIPIDFALLAGMSLPEIDDNADKEARGRLLLVAGSRELAGAVLLAGTAALRAGAGKLQIGTCSSVALQVAVAIPEARVIAYSETGDGGIADSDLDALVQRGRKAKAVLTGCGMNSGQGAELLLRGLMETGAASSLIVDAAALHCLPALEEKLRARPGKRVLLPHAGEAARLLGCSREEVRADPAAAARLLAARFAAVAAVKGSRTVIASPDGTAFSYAGGGVGLATSGSGDVLAGIVGGLAARGAEPLIAVLWGVWLHGEAGRLLSERVGRLGFLAREIAPLVPALLDRQDSIHERGKGL